MSMMRVTCENFYRFWRIVVIIVLSVKLLYCGIAGLNRGICSVLRGRERLPFIMKSMGLFEYS